MASYIVNKNAQFHDGYHEVHVLNGTCTRLPNRENWVPLGEHATCYSADQAAKRIYPKSDGCHYCAPFCHTR